MKFLTLKCYLSVLLISIMFSCKTEQAEKLDVPIIDCHVHIWDTRRPEGISWPRPEHKELYRPYLPEHISPVAKKNNVQAIVAMQSGQTLADNQWNLDTIKSDPLFKGVVGNLSKAIATDRFSPLFNKLCEDERYLGYRLSGKYQDGLSEKLIRDLRITAQKGKSVDFLVGGYSFEDIAVIAKRVPELRIILDHFGGVSLDGKALPRDWVVRFKKMGQYPNVYCKVSAMYGRFKEQPAPKELKYYREILDLAWEVFGEDRLVYSSDWPVTEMTGDYSSVVDLTKSYFVQKGSEAMQKVFYENALKFYRVPLSD